MESDPNIIRSLHLHVGRSNPSAILKPQPWFEEFPVDASMDKYKKRQQQQFRSDFKPTRREDENRRTKMRMEREIRDTNNHDSSGKISNSTSSSLHKQPQPNGGGGSRGRSPRRGFDPQINDVYKTSARGPNLPPGPSVNEKKVVNWRLACFMCNEYLTRGTLLGRPWPSRYWHEGNDKSQPKSGPLDQDGGESRREQERVYYTVADFLQAGDVHLPCIVNPSQLAACLGL